MRPIDADALKLEIVEEGQRSKRYKIGEFWELNGEEIRQVIDAQPTMPTIERNGEGWIPCSERLPEEDKAVLIWCTERKNIYCAYLEEKQWWIFGAYFQKVPLEVVAWMPLPQPYKGE